MGSPTQIKRHHSASDSNLSIILFYLLTTPHHEKLNLKQTKYTIKDSSLTNKKVKVTTELGSPNVRLAAEKGLIRESTNVKERTQNAGHLNGTPVHVNPFRNPPLMIHK